VCVCVVFGPTVTSQNSHKISVVETRNVVTKFATCENLYFGGTTHRLQTPATYYERYRLWTDFWNKLQSGSK